MHNAETFHITRKDTQMEPAERLAEIAKLIEPYLDRYGNSEVGDLARSIRTRVTPDDETRATLGGPAI